MLDDLAGDDHVECFVEGNLIKPFEVSPVKIFFTGGGQNIEAGLIEIETIQFGRDLFEIKMQQHAFFDRIFCVRPVCAAEVKHPLLRTKAFNKFDALYKFHRQAPF